MEIIVNRKQGGQPFNQNALRHGYYSKTLDAAGKRDYEEAKTLGGLEEEIALLRAKMMGVLRYDPNNTRLLTHAMATLARLLMTRRQISKDDREGLEAAMTDVLSDAKKQLGGEPGKILEK
jgi:hypothetical protein